MKGNVPFFGSLAELVYVRRHMQSWIRKMSNSITNMDGVHNCARECVSVLYTYTRYIYTHELLNELSAFAHTGVSIFVLYHLHGGLMSMLPLQICCIIFCENDPSVAHIAYELKKTFLAGASWLCFLKRELLRNNYKWAASSEFGTYRLCEQRRFRRACASAQSRQNLRCSLI